MTIEVQVRNNNVEKAIRVLKKKTQKKISRNKHISLSKKY